MPVRIALLNPAVLDEETHEMVETPLVPFDAITEFDQKTSSAAQTAADIYGSPVVVSPECALSDAGWLLGLTYIEKSVMDGVIDAYIKHKTLTLVDEVAGRHKVEIMEYPSIGGRHKLLDGGVVYSVRVVLQPSATDQLSPARVLTTSLQGPRLFDR